MNVSEVGGFWRAELVRPLATKARRKANALRAREKFDVDKLLVAVRLCQHNFQEKERAALVRAAGGGRGDGTANAIQPEQFQAAHARELL